MEMEREEDEKPSSVFGSEYCANTVGFQWGRGLEGSYSERRWEDWERE